MKVEKGRKKSKRAGFFTREKNGKIDSGEEEENLRKREAKATRSRIFRSRELKNKNKKNKNKEEETVKGSKTVGKKTIVRKRKNETDKTLRIGQLCEKKGARFFRLAKDNRGQVTLEATIAVPLFLLFFALLVCLNLRVFGMVREDTVSRQQSFEGLSENCADTHRKISSILDAGGNIYEMLFGD